MNMHAQISQNALSIMAFFGVGTAGDFFLSGCRWLVFYILPLVVVAFAVYKAFSVPLRRQEQTRIFLDVIEAGFRQGRRPEYALAQAAQTNDRALGNQFLQIAALLENGYSLSQAMGEVRNFVPAQVAATLRAGEKLGNLRKVLPACRSLLRDANSQTRNAFNFLVISSLVIMPLIPVLILLIRIYVFPAFLGMMAGAGELPPPVTLLAMQMAFWVARAQLLLALCLWCWVIFYVRGPRDYGWTLVDGSKTAKNSILSTPLWNFIGGPLAPWRDRILCALPWRRRRLQRDFCATLSLLLDGETPEPAAISLAGEATANWVFVRRARRALEDLAAGKPLQMALQRFDHAREFSWRLANAAAQHGGFLPALSGWMESLDAKAFQEEQTASQLITTGLVLWNGLVVGLIAMGIFSVLISLQQ
jgi:type II secretory pathway component PulF